MILRPVFAHSRKQEWTAIGLDFLIVVVDVDIGLQVNNDYVHVAVRFEIVGAIVNIKSARNRH